MVCGNATRSWGLVAFSVGASILVAACGTWARKPGGAPTPAPTPALATTSAGPLWSAPPDPPVITLHPDGRVTLPPGVPLPETARIFWDAVEAEGKFRYGEPLSNRVIQKDARGNLILVVPYEKVIPVPKNGALQPIDVSEECLASVMDAQGVGGSLVICR